MYGTLLRAEKHRSKHHFETVHGDAHGRWHPPPIIGTISSSATEKRILLHTTENDFAFQNPRPYVFKPVFYRGRIAIFGAETLEHPAIQSDAETEPTSNPLLCWLGWNITIIIIIQSDAETEPLQSKLPIITLLWYSVLLLLLVGIYNIWCDNIYVYVIAP